jgi:recombination protein RecR
MAQLAKPLEHLIERLVKLPGIGEKSATRLALFLLKAPAEEVEALSQALVDLKRKLRTCSVCFNYTEEDPCTICRDPRRNDSQICVVEEPGDLMAIESSGGFTGKYHVLHGVISPLDGIEPEDLRIQELVERVTKGTIREVILATNPSVEGESTSLYIAKLLKPTGVKVTRIAYGLPAGGDVQYADKVTLEKAIENRREL